MEARCGGECESQDLEGGEYVGEEDEVEQSLTMTEPHSIQCMVTISYPYAHPTSQLSFQRATLQT